MEAFAKPTLEFVPVQSLDIEAESRITFDLYINLPLNQKYILYRRAGGTLQSEQMRKLTDRKFSTFFIDKKDYREFIKYVAARMINLMAGDLSSQDKAQMTAMARAVLSSTFNQNDMTMTKALIGNLNQISQAIIENVLDKSVIYHKKSFQKLVALAEKGSDFQRHPLNVAGLAVLITYGIGYSNDRIISDIAMAALLHDVGLSKLDPKLIMSAHSLSKLTPNERAELHRHPEFSIQILGEKGISLSDLAQTIVIQHHEEFNGNGYPYGIRGYAVNEMSQILRVADDLDTLISDGFSVSGELRLKVMNLIDDLHRTKVAEPTLLARIRGLLI